MLVAWPKNDTCASDLPRAPLRQVFNSDKLSRTLFFFAHTAYVTACTGQLPQAVGVLDANRGTSIRAGILQAAQTIVLIFLSSHSMARQDRRSGLLGVLLLDRISFDIATLHLYP